MIALHVGSGGDDLPSWLADYNEVRVDINPETNPHIVADMGNMPVESNSCEAVYCSHSLEHVHSYEVPKVLDEFYRVLKPQGRVFIVVPDLEGVMPTEDILFTAPSGHITGLDMIFGHRGRTKDNPHMAHKTGFVQWTLERAIEGAGFKTIVRRLPAYNLLGVGVKI